MTVVNNYNVSQGGNGAGISRGRRMSTIPGQSYQPKHYSYPHIEHNGNTFVTVSHILMEWSAVFFHQDKTWQTSVTEPIMVRFDRPWFFHNHAGLCFFQFPMPRFQSSYVPSNFVQCPNVQCPATVQISSNYQRRFPVTQTYSKSITLAAGYLPLLDPWVTQLSFVEGS